MSCFECDAEDYECRHAGSDKWKETPRGKNATVFCGQCILSTSFLKMEEIEWKGAGASPGGMDRKGRGTVLGSGSHARQQREASWGGVVAELCGSSEISTITDRVKVWGGAGSEFG